MKLCLRRLTIWMILLLTALAAPACASSPSEAETKVEDTHTGTADMLLLPELAAVALNNEPLRVLATTSIIGDVVSQVGGEAIELTTLMAPGQDPHSYEPAVRDLTAAANAHVIFVNGWDLEEGVADDLGNIAEDVPIVPISANITPLEFDGAEDNHEHSGADPHVWFDIHNVEQWVDNVVQALSDLDPANAGIYKENAANYLSELEALEDYTKTELAQIPEENRYLVTNHESFAYLSEAYNLPLLATVLPASSTLAEPAASDLTSVIKTMEEHGVCTLFSETTANDALAKTVADELNNCDEVKVLPLYTGSLGAEGSGANSYIEIFRANVDTIVNGLK